MNNMNTDNEKTPTNTINPSLQSWFNKLLVLLLCAISFYAGWKAYQSRMVDNCLDSGGQISEARGFMDCEW